DVAGQVAGIVQRDWAIETYGCSDGVACDPASSISGQLTKGFDVIAGNTYFVELEIEAIAEAIGGNPAVVPVPAAAWLFGSGLIGLIGVARRKKA
ncbi:MAG: VPLPA-CTERM sorting domain-containing protein, partial [Gammaproteobacteria bacterium]|nr:VPLPA-CTERM sorting domain-containing protein [Gammaproteobacteria bacterium]NNJ51240.1 VPLPA-CTERM sorting domain-containing protein [Gammaproteobacteria bacterium]